MIKDVLNYFYISSLLSVEKPLDPFAFVSLVFLLEDLPEDVSL